jgi:hypothetical protein
MATSRISTGFIAAVVAAMALIVGTVECANKDMNSASNSAPDAATSKPGAPRHVLGASYPFAYPITSDGSAVVCTSANPGVCTLAFDGGGFSTLDGDIIGPANGNIAKSLTGVDGSVEVIANVLQYAPDAGTISVNGQLALMAGGKAPVMVYPPGPEFGSQTPPVNDLGGGVGVVGIAGAMTNPTITLKSSGDGVLYEDQTTLTSYGLKHFDFTRNHDTLAAANQGVISTQHLIYQSQKGTARTTDAATSVPIVTIPTVNGAGLSCWINYVARAVTQPPGGHIGDIATAMGEVALKNVAGTVSLVTALGTPIQGDQSDTSMSTVNFTAGVSGTSLALTVTGIADVTIDHQIRFDCVEN